MNYHYLITDLDTGNTLDSRRFEDFEGYPSYNRAESIAKYRAEENRLKSYDIAIIPVERIIKTTN